MIDFQSIIDEARRTGTIETEPLLPEELDWSRTNPCADCPFVRTSPFHQGIAAGVSAVFDSIEAHQFGHTCHKTDNRPSCDGPRNFTGRTQHCAGAILMLLKTGNGYDLQIPLLKAAERGDLDLQRMTDKANRSPEVFSLFEFIRFNAAGALALRDAQREEEGE